MTSHPSRKRRRHSPPAFISAPSRSRQRWLLPRIVFPFLLALLLFSGMLGNGVLSVPQAYAAVVSPTPPTHATTTLGKFLAQKAPTLHPFVYPKEQPVSHFAKEQQKNMAKVLPSSEPIHMAPLQQAISPTLLASSTPVGTVPLQMHGSDGRLTVSVPVGAIDASQATTASKASVASTVQAQGVHLTITQQSGISTGNVDSLGFYQFQFSDTQGHVLTGIRLRHPLTIQLHYAPADLQGLGLDPGSLLLTWPPKRPRLR